MWTGLQGAEDVGEYISASDADVAAMDRQNSVADYIIRVAQDLQDCCEKL